MCGIAAILNISPTPIAPPAPVTAKRSQETVLLQFQGSL